MIQPLSTLNDRGRILQLPARKKAVGMNSMLTDPDEEKTEEENQVSDARQNYYQKLKDTKVSNVDSLLLDSPDKPELDKDQIQRNKKMAKNAALFQVIDSLAGVVGMAKNPESAITTPSRFGQLGLSAVDNIFNMQDEHKVDMRRFQQRKDRVDQYNTQLQHETNQFNKGIDSDIASQQYNEALQKDADKKKEKLEKETRERLENDKEKSQYFDLALRMTSAGKPEAAYEFAKLAGLGSKEIDELFGDTGGQQFTDKQITLYNEYEHYKKLASEEDDYNMVAGERVVKQGSPSWHRDKLMEAMGEDFYMLDYQMRQDQEKQEKVRIEEENKARSDQFKEDPKVQEGLKGSNVFLQKALMTNVMNAPDQATREEAAQKWIDRNTQLLKDSGVPDNQIDQYNDAMFKQMLEELGGSPAAEQQEEAEQPKVTEASTDEKPDKDGVPSFEEFSEQVTKSQMEGFREDTEQTRQILKHILIGAGNLVGRGINVLTSPMHVLKNLLYDIPKERQKELYEEYVNNQKDAENVAQN